MAAGHKLWIVHKLWNTESSGWILNPPQLKWVNCIVWEAYLNKVIIKSTQKIKFLDRILIQIYYLWFLVPFLPHSKLFLEFFLQSYAFSGKTGKLLLVQIFKENRGLRKTKTQTKTVRGTLPPVCQYMTSMHHSISRGCPLAAYCLSLTAPGTHRTQCERAPAAAPQKTWVQVKLQDHFLAAFASLSVSACVPGRQAPVHGLCH